MLSSRVCLLFYPSWHFIKKYCNSIMPHNRWKSTVTIQICFVSLYVCTHISETTCTRPQTLPLFSVHVIYPQHLTFLFMINAYKFVCMYWWILSSSGDDTLCTSGFVNDIIFAHTHICNFRLTIQRRGIEKMLALAALLCTNVGPTLTSQRRRLVLTALASHGWPCVWPKSMTVGPT